MVTLVQVETLVDQLATKLADEQLNRYQLLDVATVLAITVYPIAYGLEYRSAANSRTVDEAKAALHMVRASIRWLQEHGTTAIESEVRERVAVATHDTQRAVSLLQQTENDGAMAGEGRAPAFSPGLREVICRYERPS